MLHIVAQCCAWPAAQRKAEQHNNWMRLVTGLGKRPRKSICHWTCNPLMDMADREADCHGGRKVHKREGHPDTSR
jgi:hypothetical protein